MTTFSSPRAAYFHVPFCARRCGYCDFTLIAGRDDLIDPYLRALEIELVGLGSPREVDSLFFGGGTPTHLPAPQLGRLMRLARKWLVLAPGCEVSVEANPTGLDPAKIQVLREAGVNRISLGVQSFDDALLERLGRDHTETDISVTLERLKLHFTNIALDLIFGVPGQTPDDWRTTLAKAISFDAQHLSTYGLTYEKGAPFWSRRRKGLLAPVPEEDEYTMYATAMNDLSAAGFEQYELSNFAKPGFCCRHNEVYWKGEPYYAFGPGAARYVDGCRETNHRSVTTWLKRTLAHQSAVNATETLSAEERAREMLFLGLRRNQGLDRCEFEDRTGFQLDQLAAEAIRRHQQTGLLEDTGTHIRLTREGRFLADSVIVDFL